MLETLISVAFWTVFGFLALSASVFLLRTAERSGELVHAFLIIDRQLAEVDYHSTDSESVLNELCEISEDTGATGITAYVFMLPAAASMVIAYLSADALQAFLAIAMAGLALFGAILMKARLDSSYESFRRCAGRTVQEIIALDAAQAAYPSLMARPRRPSRPSR